MTERQKGNFEREEVHFNSQGPSGNIFSILGFACAKLHNQDRSKDVEEMWERVEACGNYEKALDIINEYVELIDEADKEM